MYQASMSQVVLHYKIIANWHPHKHQTEQSIYFGAAPSAPTTSIITFPMTSLPAIRS